MVNGLDYTITEATLAHPSGWFHVVMVLYGAGEELVAYQDKVQTRSTNKTPSSNQPYSGKTVIGRWFVDFHGAYTSLSMDELTFWNRPLAQKEVDQLYEYVMG